MNVKKAIKRIAALAAGTTMVTATIMGAMAYDLGDYPAPFVQNGVYDGKIVIGEKAAVTDVLGAIDISASLQAASKTPVGTGSSAATVSVSGGVEISDGSNDWNWGDSADDFNSGKYDDADFPELLADGTVSDDDGTDYDYQQYIYVGNMGVDFKQDDDETGTDPALIVDLNGATEPYLNFSVEFDDTLDITELTDSETIEMFGKVYTFDPNHAYNDDLTLYQSDVTVVVTQDAPVTVESEGKEYTIEILGGNSDDSTAIVRVTGDSTSTKTLSTGDSKTMAGLDLFMDDVFISNIGGDTISVQLFVGSDKIVIPSESINAVADYNEIEIDGNDETGVYAWIEGTGLNDTDGLHFYVDMTDNQFENERTGDDWKYMVEGDSFTDPLFDFSFSFDSVTPALTEGREMLEFENNGDTVNLKFTNNDGDDYNLEFLQSNSGTLSDGDDFVMGDTNIFDNAIFILNEDSTQPEDTVTKIYEVVDVEGEVGSEEVKLRDLGKGTTKTYDLNDEIDDTGVTIDAVDVSDNNFTISSASLSTVVMKGGFNLTLDDVNLSDGYANISMTEDSDDLDEQAATTLTFEISTDSNDDIDMSNVAGGNAATDDSGDNRFVLTQYGTYIEQEVDEESAYVKVYYSEDELDFHVFINGPDAVVVTSGSSSSGSAYQVNEFVVGQVAMYDSEAMSLIGSTPLISVGGPCVNTVSMSLLGNPEVCWEGFTQGKGKIKLFSDKNALLVAGYSGEDTTGACYVLADYKNPDYTLTGSEVEVISTNLNDLSVNNVE